MISRFDETGASQIMVEPVEDVTAYGVVDCKGESPEAGRKRTGWWAWLRSQKLTSPSNLAVVGR